MDDAVEGIESSDPNEVLVQLCGDDHPLLERIRDLCGL
jgi:hypothetical protein